METKLKKKILYVITKSNFGGAQRYVFELALHFKKAGHEVAVALGGTGLLYDRLKESGIQVFPIPSFTRDISVQKELHACFELYDVMRSYKPDIVHLNSSKAGLIGSFVGRIARVPHIIFTAHGWPHNEERPLHWRMMVKLGSWITALLSHNVIVVSQYDFEHSGLSIIQNRSMVIKTAVPDIPFLSRDDAREIVAKKMGISPTPKDLWLTTTAEITANKNLFTAVNAVCAFNARSNSKVHYCIAGDGEDRDALIRHIDTMQSGAYIHLLGYVPDMRILLKAFDMCLLPSKKEGMPYALLEAGAAGLPCIASRVGGIPEIITHDVSGMLINPHDAETITEALMRLVESPQLRTEYGTALHGHITHFFTLANMIKETTLIYSRMSRAT